MAHIAERVETYNRLYLDFLFDTSLREYEGLYPMMGNAHVMTTKVTWNAAWYWGIVATLIFHRKWDDLDFLRAIESHLWRVHELQVTMQKFLKEWHHLHQYEYPANYVDYLRIRAVTRFHVGMGAGLDDEALKKQIAENVSLIEEIAAEIFRQAPDIANVTPRVTELTAEFDEHIWAPLTPKEAIPAVVGVTR